MHILWQSKYSRKKSLRNVNRQENHKKRKKTELCERKLLTQLKRETIPRKQKK